MKRLVALVAVVALVGVLVPGLASAQAAQAKPAAQTAEQAITALEHAWLTAFTTSDTAWYEKNMAAGLVSTTEKGELRDKAGSIARLKSEPFKGTSTDADVKVIVYGDTAIAIGIETDKGTQGGKDASGTYRWTDTWMKINGQWQCVASHSSTIEKK
jgi:ketosteroid isomerase-like protein